MQGHVGRVLSIALFASISVALLAQETTGRIVGKVTDSQGAVVADAKVTVTNVGTGNSETTATDKDGQYQALHLPIGAYKVSASKTGFRTAVIAATKLEINQALKIDIVLAVGSVSEVVDVKADTNTVETVNSTVGNSVTDRPIVNLPLNGRDVLSLAALEPGVTEGNNPGNSSAGNVSIAGGRTDSVTFLLDGGNNNNLLNNGVVFNPNPDTIAEFRILESNYSAEYGRNGGGIISVVTKSGTNQFHGSGFEFLRRSDLNAVPYFRKRYDQGPDNLSRDQFGGTIGGPIVKNKAFFFFGYQGQRQNQLQSSDPHTVFTPLELTGDFSQSSDKALVAAFLANNSYYQPDPAKAAQGIIDPTRIDPVSQKYIAAGLIPSTTDPSGTLTTTASSKDDADEYTGKFDYNITSSDHLSLSIGHTKAPSTSPFQGGAAIPFPVTFENKISFFNLSYTKTFTANLLNEARFTAQRFNRLQDKPAKKLPTAADLGIGTTPDESTGPPIIYFYDSGVNLGFDYHGPTTLINNTFSYSDTLTWVKGRHTIKGGFQFTPYQNNTVYDYLVNGEFDFYGQGTGAGSGAEFADFLMGIPDEYYQFGHAPSNIRSKSYYFFGQDEWRVTPRLTLTYGLRYEYSSPKFDTQGRSFSLAMGQQSTRFVNAPLGLLFPGDKGAPKGANFPDRNDFAPRLGFAWDVFGNGHTSLRGGVGVFYDILKGEDNLQFNGQAPFFGYVDFNFDPPSGTAPTGYFQDPFGSTGAVNTFPSKPPAPDINFDDAGFLPFGGGGVYFVDRHLRTPYVYQYNLSVQRQLPGGMMGEAAYVGNTSHKLTSLTDSNPFVLGTTTRVFNTQPGVPSYGFSYLDTFKNISYSNYNSLQLSLRKQLTTTNNWFGATYFTLGYTWAKGMDNASGFRQNNPQVPAYQPRLFYAVSDMNIRHRFTFSGGWDLPFAHMWQSGPKALTKGWSLYPIITWRSGFPVDPWAHLPVNRKYPGPSGAGDSNLVRPNLVGSSVTTFNPSTTTDPGTGGQVYFSPSNFEWASLQDLNGTGIVPTPAQATYGSLGRNSFYGPSRTNMDLAISKTTGFFGERAKLELRLEAFNVFNHTEFDNPETIVDRSTFGQITSTADPRILQIGIRVTF